LNNKSSSVLNDSLVSCPNLDYVDMLRGLAIIGVLLAHSAYGMSAAGLHQLPFRIEWILAAGKHGVTLFFVVSAFALMRSISLRHKLESRPIQKYFLRRFFRIAPAYYIVIILVFFISGKGVPGYTNPAEEHLSLLNLIAHLTFVNGLFPFYSNDFLGVEWSVSTEFTFYLILPAIFLWINMSASPGWRVFRALVAYCSALFLSWLMYFKG
jgi:peptidoglycan/LPS O-acetylase OafA/YrhL